MMLEGRRREGHFQGNFLLPTVLIMRVFSITESESYGREKIDLGCTFQTSLKYVKYAQARIFQMPSPHT